MNRTFAVRSLAPLCLAAAVAVPAMSAPAALIDLVDITWSLGPNLPANRKAGAMGYVNGQLVYASGSQDGTVFETTTTFGWTPGAANWINLPDAPIQNGYLDGLTYNGELYTIGGRLGGMGGSTQRTVRRFKFQNGTYSWETLPQLMTLSRGFHTVGQIGSKFYAVGGGRFANGQPVPMYERQVKDADSFDVANAAAGWSRIPDLPGIERFGPVTAGVNGKLYVFGGTNLGGPGAPYDSDRLNDAFVYNPASNSWASLPNLPFGYSNGYASVFKDRYIIMVGGVAEIDEGNPNYPPTVPNYYNNMVIVYDTRAGTYTIMPSVMPFGTGDLRAVLVGTTLYAVGGETKGQEQPVPQFNSSWLRVGQLQLGPGEWTVDSSGNWTDADSWSTFVPNGVGSFANLLQTITGPRTVTLDAPVSAGFITFNNTNRYTVTGTSTLTLQVASGDGFISLTQGDHSILAPIHLASPMKFLGPGALTTGNISSSTTLTIQTTTTIDRIDGAGTVVVSGGRTLTAQRVRQNAVTVNGTLVLSGSGDAQISRVNALTIVGAATPTGKVNVGDSGFVIDYTGSSPLATVQAQINAGRAAGAWNGNGINSSAAAGSGGAGGVGFAEASELGITAYAGMPVDGTTLIVRYTLLGDANLDRTVNISDFSILASSFNTAGTWARGDANYDGTVNIGDFSLLAANFNQSLASESRSAIPEPVSFAGVAAGLLAVRRARTRAVNE